MAADTVTDVLRRLVGRMPLEDFNEQVRERRMAHFTNVFEGDSLENVMTVPQLERLLHEDARLTPNIDIFDGTHLRRFVDQPRKPEHTNFHVVAESLRRGATIRIRAADQFDPRLGELIRGLERTLAGQCDGNIYLTPPGSAGFPPHFDITDVFVVQCAGRKHWRIYDRYENMAELPAPDAGWEPGRFEPTSKPRELTLNKGDVLYLPRGVMHSAHCTERESMHLTISLASPSVADLLRKAIAAAAAADVELRRRVRPSASDAEGTRARAQVVRDWLLRLASNPELPSWVEQQRPTPDSTQ